MSDIKETFSTTFRERFEGESPARYLSEVNRFIRNQIGFTKYHMRINKIMKELVDKREWHYACSHITQYEKEWQQAIYIYLSNNSFKEEIKDYG